MPESHVGRHHFPKMSYELFTCWVPLTYLHYLSHTQVIIILKKSFRMLVDPRCICFLQPRSPQLYNGDGRSLFFYGLWCGMTLRCVKCFAQLLMSNSRVLHTRYFPVSAQRGKGLAVTFNLCAPPHSKLCARGAHSVSGQIADSARDTPSPCPAP
jgi:hypothetical protein